MIKIKMIKTGSTIVSPAVPNRGVSVNPLAYTGLFQNRKKRITVSVKCFYVEVSGHHFLVDAGWSQEVAKHPLRHLGFGLYFASEPVMKRREAAAVRLRNHQPECILMTHLDCDHASGLRDFPNTKVYAAKEETAYAKKQRIRYGSLVKSCRITPLRFHTDLYAPFGYSCDVFGDGSCIAYLTPTHSAGSVIYQINDGDDFALLVGDNGYSEDSWKLGLIPGPLYHEGNMRRALEWIRQKSELPNCKAVLCAHDPVDRELWRRKGTGKDTAEK